VGEKSLAAPETRTYVSKLTGANTEPTGLQPHLRSGFEPVSTCSGPSEPVTLPVDHISSHKHRNERTEPRYTNTAAMCFPFLHTDSCRLLFASPKRTLILSVHRLSGNDKECSMKGLACTPVLCGSSAATFASFCCGETFNRAFHRFCMQRAAYLFFFSFFPFCGTEFVFSSNAALRRDVSRCSLDRKPRVQADKSSERNCLDMCSGPPPPPPLIAQY